MWGVPPAAAIAGIIFGLWLLSAGRAEAHLDGLVHVKPYTYNNSSCSDGNEVDPISVVLYTNATTGNVQTHAAHHGWNQHEGSSMEQRFYQHGCVGMSAGESTPFMFGFDRYHMRHRWHYDPSEPSMGTYALTTPHYDHGVACNWHEVGHAVNVPAEWASAPSGFVAAKWELGQNWHNWNYGGSAHFFQGSQYWGNTIRIQQCNGQWHANDGWVDFVQIL